MHTITITFDLKGYYQIKGHIQDNNTVKIEDTPLNVTVEIFTLEKA